MKSLLKHAAESLWRIDATFESRSRMTPFIVSLADIPELMEGTAEDVLVGAVI
jgi:hypothetical protein